jgi:imidazolonepropionase-like amidohydrolase
MQTMKLTLIILLSTVGFPFLSNAQTAEQKTAFVGVHVVSMNTDHLLTNQTVIVLGSKILDMGPTESLQIPPGCIRIEGKGLFLMPGLVDMHAHLPSGQPDEIPLHEYLTLNVMRGVTSIRSMRGDMSHLKLKDSIDTHALPGPNLYLGSPVLPKEADLTADKARKLIAEYKKANFHFIKYLYPLRPSLYDSVMAIAKEQGIKVAGHCPKAGLEAALKAKQASVEHLEPFLNAYKKDSVKFGALMHKMADAHISACPDIQWYYVFWNQLSISQLKHKEGMKLLSPDLTHKWISDFEKDYTESMKKKSEFMLKKESDKKDLELALRMLKTMQESGVPLLISAGDGDFIIPGFSVLDECRNFVEAGISPYETLKAATVHAAAFFGESEVFGQVQKGFRADLLLLEENPLENIENLAKIKGVMVKGRWFSGEELAGMQTQYGQILQVEK